MLKKRQGFTLIETILYSALMSLTVGGVFFVAYQLINGSEKTTDKVVIEEEANFILKKIQWALTGMQTINTPASGASGSTLSINKHNYGSNPIVLTHSGGIEITMQKGGGSAVPLNSLRVPINSLNFEHIAPLGNTQEGVKTTINLGGREYKLVVYMRK